MAGQPFCHRVKTCPKQNAKVCKKNTKACKKNTKACKKSRGAVKTHFLRRSTYNLKSEHLKRRKRKDAPIGKLKKDDLTNSNLVILIL